MGSLSVFLRVGHAPTPREQVPGIHQIFWSSMCTHSVCKTTTKFCMVIKVDVRKILQSRPRMLTRDPFAVANLVLFYLLDYVQCYFLTIFTFIIVLMLEALFLPTIK